MKIIVQLEILNTGSHFSEDKYNLAILYLILLVIFMALGFVNYKKYQEDKEKFEEEDSPLYFTFGSLNMIWTHCLSNAFTISITDRTVLAQCLAKCSHTFSSSFQE